jgi:lactose/L-arabinose transport system ATP-binding protein
VPALGRTIAVDAALPAKGTAVTIGLRPEHLEVTRGQGALTAELSEALGGVSYLYLTTPTGERIIVEERGDDRASEGETVDISFEQRRVMLFHKETGLRIR